MTDRVPGAPGQYILTVSAAEAQKILTGEPVAVTLKRDDQPLVEGTPYNKASVLPDELASILCPGVLDPTPADAFSGVLKKAAPYNYADNSGFTQWVAQPGLCKSHAGSVAIYAGDRWILDSGNVSGVANENGNGYSNIKLNGTIRQIIANPPAVGSVFVDMVAGTAEAVYENGKVTITSNGGVIRNVLLCEGQYTEANRPKYQPKGYGAELAECKRYYYRSYGETISNNGMLLRSAFATNRLVGVDMPCEMRITPTVILYGVTGKKAGTVEDYFTDAAVSGATTVYKSTKAFIPATNGGLTAGKVYMFHYEASADFPEED